jgi:hypothetical protein
MNTQNTLSALAMMSILAACAGDASTMGGEPASELGGESTPLTTVQIAPDHVVEFYELGDTVMVSELAPRGTASLIRELGLERSNALDVWEALRPGEEAPAALLEVASRSLSDQEILEEEPASEPGEGGGLSAAQLASNGKIGHTQQALTGSEFLAQGYCNFTEGGRAYTVCYPDWANGFYAYAYSKYASIDVASNVGAFHANLSAPNGAGSYYVGSGQLRSFFMMGASCSWYELCARKKATMRIDITDAANDTFSVGGVWYNG